MDNDIINSVEKLLLKKSSHSSLRLRTSAVSLLFHSVDEDLENTERKEEKSKFASRLKDTSQKKEEEEEEEDYTHMYYSVPTRLDFINPLYNPVIYEKKKMYSLYPRIHSFQSWFSRTKRTIRLNSTDSFL
jgi:hypothetical protein